MSFTMTKSELLAKIAELPDDAEIRFVLFDDNKYDWRLIQLNAQSRNDPANIFGLVTSPIRRKDIKEFSTI